MTPEDQARLLGQLKADEGLRLSAYVDSLGFLTIGYGHLIDARKGGKISHAAAEFIFEEDITEKLSDLAPYSWFQAQDSVRQAALANMIFNTDLLHFPLFLVHMGNKDYVGAVAQIQNTPWHREVGARADRIIKLIETGAWP